MTTPTPSEPDLTFHWPVEKGFPFILFLCVAGSLFAHTATFFLFQVVYPQRVTIPQPAPHVSLLTPSSPENIALLRSIEAEDPALIAADNTVPPPGLVVVQYRPSFAAPRTAPLGAPGEQVKEVAFPPAMDRIAALSPALVPAVAAPSASSATVMEFAGALASRPVARNPPLAAPRLAVDPVSPTILLVGVNDSGEIRYPVLQQSAGDTKLDDLAISHVNRVSFAPAGAPMTWGYVTFAWGADAYVDVPAPDRRIPRQP